MTRGGFREGSGRKPRERNWSEKFKSRLWKSLEKQGKIQGMTVFDMFAKMLFDPTIQDSSFVGLWKILSEVMATKESKRIVEEHNWGGPAISLPPIKERPQETFSDDSKKDLIIDVSKKLN